jgi:hypothetical protein
MWRGAHQRAQSCSCHVSMHLLPGGRTIPRVYSWPAEEHIHVNACIAQPTGTAANQLCSNNGFNSWGDGSICFSKTRDGDRRRAPNSVAPPPPSLALHVLLSSFRHQIDAFQCIPKRHAGEAKKRPGQDSNLQPTDGPEGRLKYRLALESDALPLRHQVLVVFSINTNYRAFPAHLPVHPT